MCGNIQYLRSFTIHVHVVLDQYHSLWYYATIPQSLKLSERKCIKNRCQVFKRGWRRKEWRTREKIVQVGGWYWQEGVSCGSHTTTFKFSRPTHLLNNLLMSKKNLHISSNFLELLCIGMRCFQPEVAKSSQFMCFIGWAPMLVHITSWTGV